MVPKAGMEFYQIVLSQISRESCLLSTKNLLRKRSFKASTAPAYPILWSCNTTIFFLCNVFIYCYFPDYLFQVTVLNVLNALEVIFSKQLYIH